MYKKVAIWILLILLLSLAMQLVVRYALDSDPNKTSLESWLSSQHEVVSLVGSSFSFEIRSRVSVEATSDLPGYSRYTVVLSGKERKALVVVMAPQGRGGYRIDSISPL